MMGDVISKLVSEDKNMSTKWTKRWGKGRRGPERDEQRKGGFLAEKARC